MVTKAEIKMLVLHELGVEIDDVKEVAERDLERVIGEMAGLQQAAAGLKSVREKFAQELGEEAALNLAERYLDLARQSLQDLALRAEATRYALTGRISALDTVVKLVAKRHAAERLKMAEEPPIEVEAKARPPAREAVVADLAARKAAAKSRKKNGVAKA